MANIIPQIEALIARGVTHALTLWPEWRYPIVELDDKRVENRGWSPPARFVADQLAREPALIALHWGTHIGGRPGNQAKRDGCRSMLHAARFAGWTQRGVGAWQVELTRGDRTVAFDADALIRGAIDIIIRVTTVTRPGPLRAGDPYYTGECGWRFEVVERLEQPISCKGARGLWPLRSLLGVNMGSPRAGAAWG